MRSSVVAALAIVIATGCKDPGSDLAFGPATAFRLARVHDRFDIGIDLTIRIPDGFDPSTDPFRRSWFGPRRFYVRVTTHPEEQVTYERPCGETPNPFGRTYTIAAQIGRADDVTFVCKARIGNELQSVWVIRLIKSIDTVIQCEAYTGVRLASVGERLALLRICGSLKVVGRSPWSSDDYMLPEDKPPKPWQ